MSVEHLSDAELEAIATALANLLASGWRRYHQPIPQQGPVDDDDSTTAKSS